MSERETSPDNQSRGRDDQAPERPTQLPGGSWWAAVKRTVREFQVDNLKDWAAALTYYSVLSIFPALVVLISLVDLAGRSTIQTLLDNLGQVAPGSVNQILEGAIRNLQQTRGSAGLLALIGLAAALWSASNYIAAFMRASNAIYDVPEADQSGRPCPSGSGSPWSSWSCWRCRRWRWWPPAAWPTASARCWDWAAPWSPSGIS